MKKVLIIEDDKHLNKGLSISLKDSYEVISSYTLKDSLELIDNTDLIILDMNLPDGDGLEIIKYTRKNLSTPIIVLSAIDLEPYIISAIELGADDYLTKPFSLGILKAKIKRIFESYKVEELNSFIKGPFNFEFQRNKFTVDNNVIELTPTEFKILYYLIKNKTHILTKDSLLDLVWEEDDRFIDKNTLSVNISRIRAKLKPYDPIDTVFGVGYRWNY